MSHLTKFFILSILVIVTGCTEHSHSHGPEHHHHSHSNHDHTPHMGVSASFLSGASKIGVIELKLHDDKGDLELWLTKDKQGTQPFDLDLGSVITVSFPKMKKAVNLQVRDKKNNKDEDGKGNIRENKTNYFIFPGDTGVDASFLVGKGFAEDVVVTFTANGTAYTTAPFELRPHTH